MRILGEHFKRFLFFSLMLALVLPIFLISAEESNSETATPTDEITSIETNNSAGLIEERQALEEELKKLEEQIAQYEENIDKTQQDKKTLQNQVYILKQKIGKLNLQIQESNVMIRDIGFQIEDTETSIENTSLKIEDFRQQLTNILQVIYEKDQLSLIEILLSAEELSDFFNDLMQLEVLNSKNQELLEQIKNLKFFLENQRGKLDEEKTDLERVRQMQLLQKNESETTKKEKDWLLEQTKGKESEYQKLLTETKKKAAEIRARIFELIGVPEAPTFGEAYELAKEMEKITGIRPAFLLAVLTQESNIGKNVGQCFLKDSTTGAGVKMINGTVVANVMKPSRDIPYFLKITQELGRDPYNTPVSCPIPSIGGYGGAMGPAQFIPATWIRYRDRVKEITGKPADPWDIKDAFLAAALYLADYGAKNQTRDAEWKAAMIYFSGSTKTKYRFYGDSVLSIAARYEEDIKAIE